MTGRTLSHYQLLEKLGEGGMGVVYRARDTRLGREVAIKVLPEAIARNSERLARFEREARVLASLNHANIASIYEFGQAGGVTFLVLELVPGHILGGPVELPEALRLAVQIATALEAAHDKGIVHRDLKPSNIKVTPEGRVKVLDFGLAKVFSTESGQEVISHSPTLTAGMTKDGVLLGTAAYMSPEQARGKALDHRSDVWAFGCVLFEMLVGRPAFGAESISDTLVAVLKGEPDWSRLPPGTPPAVLRVLRRSLRKDPGRRLHSMADVRLELEELAESEAPLPAPAPGARSSRAWVLALILLILGAFAGGAWWQRARVPASPSWRGELLGGSAIALAPRLSPDGQTLAFQAMVDGLNQVAVMKPDSGNWTVLTRDRSRGAVMDLRWSPDSAKIYFDRFSGVPRGIFSIPVLGGQQRLVLEEAIGPHPLPDGTLLVTKINAERKYQLYRFWPESSRLQALGALVSAVDIHPPVTVFPDGKEAAFWGRPAGEPAAPDHLYALDLASGRARRLAPGVSMMLPSDAFPLAAGPGGQSVLIDLPSGNLHRIVAVPRDGSASLRTLLNLTVAPWYLDAGADGTLYVDQVDRPREVLRFPVSGGVPERMAATAVSAGASVLPFPDGRVLLPSRAAGRDQLLLADTARDLVPFVDTPDETALPAALVGDTEVAFQVGPPGNRLIAVASIAEGRIIRRFRGPAGGDITTLAASPDGRVLYCAAAGAIWTLPAGGGEPRKIRDGDAVIADPRGRELIVQFNEIDAVRLARIPVEGGPQQPIPVRSELHLAPVPLAPNAVGRDGRILVQVMARDFWFWPAALLDPATGKLERIPVQYQGDVIRAGWTRDGRIVGLGLPLKAGLWRFRSKR